MSDKPLDARKLKILETIVDEYIRCGEPVGSKSVAAALGGAVSSATIRNDMVVLEQCGLLEQPHTSAGRIPTFAGYRLYIERLMSPQELTAREKQQIDELFDAQGMSDSMIVEGAATALAQLTGYATVASRQSPRFSVISRVEVIPAGRRLYALLIITSDGDVTNTVCRMEFDITDEQLEFFSRFVNDKLSGVSPEQLSPAMVQSLATALGGYMLSLSPLLYKVYQLSGELSRRKVRLTGESNLLAYRDFDPGEIARFLSDHSMLAGLLDESFSGVHVIFGRESSDFVITNSSLVTKNYRKGKENAGTVGIIGPMRLDYAKIIPYLDYFTNKMTALLSDNLTETEGKELSSHEEQQKGNGREGREG